MLSLKEMFKRKNKTEPAAEGPAAKKMTAAPHTPKTVMSRSGKNSCPQCKTGYMPWVSYCPKCKIPLQNLK